VIYTRSIWIWSPLLFVYPVVGGAVAAPFVLARLWLMRHSQADGLSSALEVLGLGLLVLPIPGLVLAVVLSWKGLAPQCGVDDLHAATTIVGVLWPLWMTGEAALLVQVALRARAIASLPPLSRAATLFTLLVTPPLTTLTVVAVAQELHVGGAAMLTLYPLSIASAATALAWAVPIDVCPPRERVVAVLVALVTVVVATGSRGGACDAFSSTQTWQLVSLDRYGWMVAVLGLALLAGRPPPLMTTNRIASRAQRYAARQ
jgi:hypothetical protein